MNYIYLTIESALKPQTGITTTARTDRQPPTKTIDTGRNLGGCCAPYGGAGFPSNTMWSGPTRTSIVHTKNAARAFQRAINQGSTPPLTSSKWHKLPKFVVFWTISTIKEEKSAAKFHYIKMSAAKL